MTESSLQSVIGRGSAIGASLALALSLMPARVDASAIGTQVDVPCARLRGFVNDPDPHGTNLRGEPRSDAPIVARIPPPVHIEGDRNGDLLAAALRVIGSHAGWLLVDNVVLGDNARTLYAHPRPAWISGTLVAFTVGSRVLHAGPGMRTPVRESLVTAHYSPDSFAVVRTFACHGRWADVALRNPERPKAPPMRGWVGAVCDTQLTTCDNTDLP